MALGTACAWTNRAAVWGFCTRLDRTAQATADWKPFTVGNLSMALSWYRRQEIRRRRPDYDTLEQDDPAAAAALAEEAGQELLVDLANPTLIAEVQAKHKDLDMTTLTLQCALSFEQSRVRREGLKSKGIELKDLATMAIWTVRGERPTPKRRSAPVARPARPVPAACSHAASGPEVRMMYLQLGEAGFDRDRHKLVLHRDDCDPKRIATIIAKRPQNGKDADQRNWAVWNGASEKGVVQSGWEDNAKFFKYLEDAPGATLKGGEIVQRQFTIREARGGWWVQHNYNNKATTIIPTHLRFRLPDADQGA